MNCKKCGQEIKENTKVCSNCGYDMESDQNSKSDSIIAEKKNKKRTVVIINVAAAAALLVGIVLYMAVFGGYDGIRVSKLCNLGDRYLSELDYESAITAYQEAIEIAPKCEDAYLGLADIYIEQEEYEKAAEILEEALAQIDSEAISSKQEEVGELLAEREKQAEEMSVSAGDASVEGNMSTEEEIAAEGEVFAEEETADEVETAVAGRMPYADEMAAIANASVGDIVYFGSYEQDSDTANGTEPVEWYVLDKADGETTLLAVYLLDCQAYHEVWEDITWENCTLRSWLNGEFYNTTFSEEEQAVIVNTNVINEDSPYFFNADGGNDTVDKVWLLSFGEAMGYFHIDMDVWIACANGNMDWYEYTIYCYGQDNRVCAKPTAYAEARGVWAYLEEVAQFEMDTYGYDESYAIGSGWWWLRSPGLYSSDAMYIRYDGCVNGYHSVDISVGVRPALKVAY